MISCSLSQLNTISTNEHRTVVEGHVRNIMASKFLRQVPKICRLNNKTILRTDRNVTELWVAATTRGFRNNDALGVYQNFRFSFERHTPVSGSHHASFHTTASKLDEIKTVKCPPFAESITEGDVIWEVEEGDAVSVDQVVGEIETDKTSVPVPSPADGVIVKLLIADGETVEAGTDLFQLKVGAGGGAAKPAAKKETPAAAAAATPVPVPVPSSPPPVSQPPTKPISVTPTSSVTAMKAADPNVIGGTRAESRVKMSRMRTRIAARLKDAQNTCAMLTTFNEIDMSGIIGLRNNYKDAFQKKHGVKLGFMSAFIKASAYALQDQPVVNAVIDGNEMVYRDFIDVSVAVASPKGLVVPVIRNVETMNFVDIERTLGELGQKAQNGDLAVEDMDGGTFTVSNGGVFGSLMGTPIINPPQSAILGMHATFPRPVAVNGKVEIRPMMYVALTYDHRLIDGKEAVTFLRTVKSAVEDPSIMFLNM